MSDVVVQPAAQEVQVPVVEVAANLEVAREAERNRFTREEGLRRELDDARRKLDSVKNNGWDLEVLSKSRKTETVEAEVDLKKELQTLKQEIIQERTRRSEVEELTAIVDFTNKNPQYELIRQLDDAPKYIKFAMNEHYKNTGKHMSYADACDYVENEIEKVEADRFSKFSKTKKADKLYKLKSEDPPVAVPTSKPASAGQVKSKVYEEPTYMSHSNSKEAFNFFKKKHGM